MIRCLNFHAAYRCRSSGVCCRSGWTIPLDSRETRQVKTLRLAQGSLVEACDGTSVAARADNGNCSFCQPDGWCAIQCSGGHDALPVSCRMFPRSVLIDARGTFISLSHYCPTAASLLFEPGPPAAIVEAPATLVDVGPLDGLDARGAWPPLVRRGVLMDLESYDAWERRGVELLTREGVEPAAALAALERVASDITSWRVGDRSLLERVEDAFASATPPAATLSADDVAVKRWLAARLFACWIAYQGDGLDAIVRYLQNCYRLFAAERARDDHAREAIRRTDLRVMHT